MYVEIKIETLRQMLREEIKQLLHEVNQGEKQTTPPLSIQQLADRYNVSKATVHNWMNQDLIKGFKMGKGRFFHLDEVEKNLTQYRYLDVLEKKGLAEKRNRIAS